MAIVRRVRPNWRDAARSVALGVLLLNDVRGEKLPDLVRSTPLAVGGVILNYWDGTSYVANNRGASEKIGRASPTVILA